MTLDARVLAGFTKVAHAVQRATGVTSFALAASSFEVLAVYFALLAVNVWFPGLLPAHTSPGLSDVLVGIFVSPGMALSACWLRAADASWRSGDRALPSTLLIMRRAISPLVRWLSLTAALLWVPLSVWAHDWLTLAGHSAFGIAYYMAMVDPLPPCRGWLRAKVSGFAAFRAKAAAHG